MSDELTRIRHTKKVRELISDTLEARTALANFQMELLHLNETSKRLEAELKQLYVYLKTGTQEN